MDSTCSSDPSFPLPDHRVFSERRLIEQLRRYGRYDNNDPTRWHACVLPTPVERPVPSAPVDHYIRGKKSPPMPVVHLSSAAELKLRHLPSAGYLVTLPVEHHQQRRGGRPRGSDRARRLVDKARADRILLANTMRPELCSTTQALLQAASEFAHKEQSKTMQETFSVAQHPDVARKPRVRQRPKTVRYHIDTQDTSCARTRISDAQAPDSNLVVSEASVQMVPQNHVWCAPYSSLVGR